MSDTIKKIEGFVDPGQVKVHGAMLPIEFEWRQFPNHVAALLLVSTDDTVPEVMTKAEAQAKDADLLWAMTWMSNEAAHLRERGQPQPALEIAIETVCERHGITL